MKSSYTFASINKFCNCPLTIAVFALGEITQCTARSALSPLPLLLLLFLSQNMKRTGLPSSCVLAIFYDNERLQNCLLSRSCINVSNRIISYPLCCAFAASMLHKISGCAPANFNLRNICWSVFARHAQDVHANIFLYYLYYKKSKYLNYFNKVFISKLSNTNANAHTPYDKFSWPLFIVQNILLWWCRSTLQNKS